MPATAAAAAGNNTRKYQLHLRAHTCINHVQIKNDPMDMKHQI